MLEAGHVTWPGLPHPLDCVLEGTTVRQELTPQHPHKVGTLSFFHKYSSILMKIVTWWNRKISIGKSLPQHHMLTSVQQPTTALRVQQTPSPALREVTAPPLAYNRRANVWTAPGDTSAMRLVRFLVSKIMMFLIATAFVDWVLTRRLYAFRPSECRR